MDGGRWRIRSTCGFVILSMVRLWEAGQWSKPGLYEIEVEIEMPDHPPVSRARRLRVTSLMR